MGVPLEHAYSIGRLSDAKDSTVVIQVDYESDDEYLDASPYGAPCADALVFYIPNYTIADIPVQELRLTFYKGLLAEIETKGSFELSEAFKTKYGKPEMRLEQTPRPCIFVNTGNKIVYQDQTITSSWYNAEISASDIISKYYNSDCQERLISFLLIRHAQKAAMLDKCNIIAKKTGEDKAALAKRKKLSDL